MKGNQTVARALAVLGITLAMVPCVWSETADQVFERIAENWRWSHYWFGKSGIDGVYAEGRRISALVFWTKDSSQPIRGLCSTELSLCLAYSGVFFDPSERRMQVAPNRNARQAFMAFLNSGFRDPAHMNIIENISEANFQVEEKSFVLPALGLPASIQRQAVPEEASRDAERVKGLFGCWGVKAETRPQGCTGSLVFAYYGEKDPYWFVLRSCSTACEFKGESVEMLRRGDHGWEVTSSGFVGSPKAEVERLKQQIERAEMFRLPL